MDRKRIVVLGGYGHFGGRICRGLLGLGGTELVVAGRSRERSQAFAAELRQTCPEATVRSATLDRSAPECERDLGALAPSIVVHTAGPQLDPGLSALNSSPTFCSKAVKDLLAIPSSGVYLAPQHRLL